MAETEENTETESTLPAGEKLIVSELLNLEDEIADDPDNPHPNFEQRLRHLLRIPDHVYHDMLEHVRDVNRLQDKIHMENAKKNKEMEKNRARIRREKSLYIEKAVKKDDLEGKSRFTIFCHKTTRKIAAWFKFFPHLSTIANFVKIQSAAWALLFWHYSMYLQVALGIGITALEISIGKQMTRSVGEGSYELLGASQGIGISVCVLYFAVAILGWIAARYRSRTLGLVYMIAIFLITIFYFVYAVTDDYADKADTLSATLAPKMREFLQNPKKNSYISHMQIYFSCCGGQSPVDYFEHDDDYIGGSPIKLPISCCLRSTTLMRERRAVKCEVKKGVPWPIYLNTKGCGKEVAGYLMPIQAIKWPFSLALIYCCILCLTASFTFFKTYKTDVIRREVPEAKLTLGEKLLAALDIHKLTMGDDSDAAVDVLRRRLGECETIPEVIQTIMEMIEEVEDLLHVDPDKLAKMLLGIRDKDLKMSGPVKQVKRASNPTKVIYLDDPRNKQMAKNLLKTGDTPKPALLQYELTQQKDVQFSNLFVVPKNEEIKVADNPYIDTEDENDDDPFKERKAREYASSSGSDDEELKKDSNGQSILLMERQESHKDRMERLLAEVIRQSQHTVRRIKKNVKFMKPLAFKSPETHGLIPHATNLLQTVESIRAGRKTDKKSTSNDEDEDHHYNHESSGSTSNSSDYGAQHLSRVSGKVMTPSEYNLDAMHGPDTNELVDSFHPEHLDQSPGRLDVVLRNWMANMRDTEN